MNDWNPSPHATYVEAIDPGDAAPGSLLVEHFNDPCIVPLGAEADALTQAAYRYLRALVEHKDIAGRFGKQLPEHWMRALEAQTSAESPFGWLPLEDAEDPTRKFSGPRGSFRFSSASDDLFALYASDRIGADHYCGSGFGLALVVRVHKEKDGPKAVFVGMSATLPFARFDSDPLTNVRADTLDPHFTPKNLYLDPAATQAMASAARLDKFVIEGVRVAAWKSGWWIERQGRGVRRSSGGFDIPYVVSMLRTSDGGATVDSILHVSPLVADANARVFHEDPASKHGAPVSTTLDERPDPPRRPIGLDDPLRVAREIFPGPQPSGGLKYQVGRCAVMVMRCGRYVAADRPAKPEAVRTVTIPAGGPAVRSDDASAIQAFFHARDLVERLQAYGWPDPARYFRLTQPEIKIFYRSGIPFGPGKDGRAVNACVFPEGWPVDAIGPPPDSTPRTPIQVHLAAADLRRRARARWKWGGERAPAIPFGIAADRRWMWHEFGHVLLVASTGELEFRFAHSAGDAMAAIVADPESTLPAPLRGSTFPFVYLPRYHHRCAADGWSWSGTMHEGLASVPAAKHPRRKGYSSEQILSSSLFRLYRCIGGDTCRPGSSDPDREARRRASHYTLYLIMQAMQLMGDARIQPTATPAGFVHWLKQADRQPGEWAATLDGIPFKRVGGTLAKVIRWAFEAQGLYGAGNGPGSPEAVDIYIEDTRGTTDCAPFGALDYGRGSYVPVSLHWQSDTDNAPPRWQADPTTGIIVSEGRVEVRVGNRGSETASKVAVRLWSAPWPPKATAPQWDAGSAVWSSCPQQVQQPQQGQQPQAATENVSPSSTASFIFDFSPGGSGRYLLFAQATCPDDRAISDPALGLACSSLPTPLADLVACDNNLGLRVVDVA